MDTDDFKEIRSILPAGYDEQTKYVIAKKKAVARQKKYQDNLYLKHRIKVNIEIPTKDKPLMLALGKDLRNSQKDTETCILVVRVPNERKEKLLEVVELLNKKPS